MVQDFWRIGKHVFHQVFVVKRLQACTMQISYKDGFVPCFGHKIPDSLKYQGLGSHLMNSREVG